MPRSRHRPHQWDPSDLSPPEVRDRGLPIEEVRRRLEAQRAYARRRRRRAWLTWLPAQLFTVVMSLVITRDWVANWRARWFLRHRLRPALRSWTAFLGDPEHVSDRYLGPGLPPLGDPPPGYEVKAHFVVEGVALDGVLDQLEAQVPDDHRMTCQYSAFPASFYVHSAEYVELVGSRTPPISEGQWRVYASVRDVTEHRRRIVRNWRQSRHRAAPRT